MPTMRESAVLSVRGTLESSVLFGSVTPEQIEDLAGRCRLSRCDKGEAIWTRHEDAGFFGIVSAGFVKMVKPTAGGADVTLEIMGPGQCFGMLGVIDGIGCPLMAFALTDAVYLRVPNEAFKELYSESASLKDRILRKTAIRMHQKIEFMTKLSSGKVEERIAAVLFILAESYGAEVGKSIVLELPLTRQQIGEMAGTTTETTIRVLSRWTQEGIIATAQQQITITDVFGLESKMSN